MLNRFNILNSVPYSQKYSSTHPTVMEIRDNLWEKLPIDKSLKVGLKKECLTKTIINLKSGWYNNNYIRYSRRKNYYSDIPIRYKPQYFTYTIMTGIIDGLESQGMLESIPGFMNLNDNSKLQSAMCATDKLFKVIEPIKNNMLVDVVPPESIILKDRKTKQKKDYKNTRTTNKMRDELSLYNELRQNTNFSMAGISPELFDIHRKYFNQYSITEIRSGTTNINLSNPYVYRVFSGSFKNGGRFYNGIESNAPSELRKKILINGNATVEKDYSSLHINMLYNMKGLDLRENAYDKVSQGDPGLRKLFKLIGLTSINSDNQRSCFLALRNEIRNNGLKIYFHDLSDKSIENYYNQWVDAHPAIKDYLNSDIGIKLQNKDSQLAAEIIKYFTGRGIPVLVVHDSFIIEKKYESELIDKMKAVYKEKFNFEPRVN